MNCELSAHMQLSVFFNAAKVLDEIQIPLQWNNWIGYKKKDHLAYAKWSLGHLGFEPRTKGL